MDVTGNVILAVTNEHSFNGSVPSVTSVPFVTPSPSQSALFHAAFGAIVWDARTKEHGSKGFVPSVSSFAFVTPSPSQSALDVTGKVILETRNEQSSNGSVPFTISVPFLTPSPSQSALFHAALGATVWDANTNEQGSFPSVPSVSSFAFVTPSPSQSALEVTTNVILVVT